MKNFVKFSFFVLLAIIYGFSFATVSAANYHTIEAFEKAEGAICEVATDGCNTLLIEDGKVVGSTLMACPELDKKVYSCKQYNISNEELKAKFTKENSQTCDVATDGINTFINIGGEFVTRTKVGYPKDFVADWTCEQEKQQDEPYACTMEYAPVCGIDGNTYGNSCMAGDVKIKHEGTCEASNLLVGSDLEQYNKLSKNLSSSTKNTIESAIDKYVAKKLTPLATKEKRIELNNMVIHNIDSYIIKMMLQYPNENLIPKKVLMTYDVLSYLKLSLKKLDI